MEQTFIMIKPDGVQRGLTDLFPANPFPSTALILDRVVPPQERRHAIRPVELPVEQQKKLRTRITRFRVSDQMMDEHHYPFFEHKHMKGLCQAMQLIQPQPPLQPSKPTAHPKIAAPVSHLIKIQQEARE
ncbi:nucleoside diphosphate kinase family protein [Striga asiatica]|uniref:Nucleoside diphosphate kinase family protein n=1 Tax=Striga asiatica TaxID=4170 RepID=A0A5A7RAR1_STRAF|nr:nucleoside diphosphate kinase family protein [Striga asiatica]